MLPLPRRAALALLLTLPACAGRQPLAPAAPGPACRDPARIVRQFAWDSARHQSIARAFDPLPGSPSAGPRVAARLDRIADNWAATRAASCQALRRHERTAADFGARAACQNAVLLQQSGLVERVTAAPGGALTRIDAGIDELEDSLQRCERPAVHARYHGARSQVAARIDLAQADVAIALGDGSWAQAIAQRAREPAVDSALAERLRPPVQIVLAWASWLRGQDHKATDRLTEIAPGDDPLAAAALAELRLLTRAADEPEAFADGAQALLAYRDLLGPTDRRLVRVHRELARRHRLAGDLVAAFTELDAALAILRARHLQPDLIPETLQEDPLHATLLHELGDLEHQRGDFARARQHHHAALLARELAYGPEQLPTAESLFALGSDHEAQGELPLAIDHYQRALKIQHALAPESLATARSFYSLGRLRLVEGNLTDARRYHSAALAIRRRNLGEQHPEVANSLNLLGMVARAEGDLRAALKLFQQALDLRERLLGADHLATVSSLDNLAELHTTEGDLARALALHERALQTRRARLGEQHPDTARTLHNIGLLQMDRGDLEAAEQALTAAATIRGATLGPGHPDTLRSLARLTELGRLREQAEAREQPEPAPPPRRRRPAASPR